MRTSVAFLMAAFAAASVQAGETASYLWDQTEEWFVDDVVEGLNGVTYGVGYERVESNWLLVAHDNNGVLTAERRVQDSVPLPAAGQTRPVAAVLDQSRGQLVVLGTLANQSGLAYTAVAAFAVPSLTPLWQTQLGSGHRPQDLALGSDGSVYVALNGLSTGGNGVTVARVSTAGVVNWVVAQRTEEATLGLGDNVIATSSTDDVYVAVRGTVLKYSPAGVLQWSVVRPVEAIHVRADNTIIASTPLNPTGQTAALSQDGAVIWSASVGGLTIVTNSDLEVWVGRSNFVDSENVDWELRKLSAAGQVQWVRTVGDSRQDMLRALAIDEQSNVVAAGKLYVRGGFLNLFWSAKLGLIKWDAAGNQVWRAEHSGTASPSVVVTSPGRVVVGALTSIVGFQTTATTGTSCPSWQFWC